MDGYLHPSFNLHLVRTYRSSCERPNFQNIPKRDKEALEICRRALLPRPGHLFIEADFAALEVMISACYHKDSTMLAYLRDPNADMHSDMACQIFFLDHLDRSLEAHNTLRQAAKNAFVFPQFYGDYWKNNAKSLAEWVKLPQSEWKEGQGIQLPDGKHISDHLLSKGIKNFDQFAEHIKQVEQDFWGRRFKEYDEWRNVWVTQYRRRGWLQMLTGFVCSGVMRRNEIINYPIQGTAFHCLLWTLIRLDEIIQKEGWDTKIVGQIHDSIVLDAHPNEREQVAEVLHHIVTKELPAAWTWIIVPLELSLIHI